MATTGAERPLLPKVEMPRQRKPMRMLSSGPTTAILNSTPG